MNKETYTYIMGCLMKERNAIIKERTEHIITTNTSGCLPKESVLLDCDARLEKNLDAIDTFGVDYNYDTIRVMKSPDAKIVVDLRDFHAEPIDNPHDFGFTDKLSALKSIKQDIAKLYPFVMCYACKDEMLTFFATLLMNYSNHDKRDVEITLKEIEHGRIHWQLVADHEILDCGNYIIDKDVPF